MKRINVILPLLLVVALGFSALPVGSVLAEDVPATPYTFAGFFAPIRMGVDNLTRAGSAVPVKWQLTQDGIPVSDPASFIAVMTYSVDCLTLVGDPLTATAEKAPGKSGLKYQGDGYWKFNWKTPKTYGGTCRRMYVSFNDGSISPEVVFRFK